MAYNLETIIDDMNGAAMASAGEAEWGYISPEWFLALPNGIPNCGPNDLPDQPLTNQGWHAKVGKNNWTKAFLKANYNRVRASCQSDEEAYFVTVFRLHMVSNNLLCKIAGRGVREDEYIFVDPQNNDWGDAANDIPQVATTGTINRWVKRYGSAILHSVAYMFLSRGHHYKQEYLEKYQKLAEVQFIDRQPGFIIPSPNVIYRLALHAFGVKPLVMLSYADRNAGRMAAAMQIRYQPHTPISGVAKFTTSKAVIQEMTKEKWYAHFAVKYQAEIADINTACAAITGNSLDYHVASRVVGGGARMYCTANEESSFLKISQLLLGYIDYLGRRHSLSGQMAITQKAGGIGPVAEGFSRACSKFSNANPAADMNDMAAYLGSL